MLFGKGEVSVNEMLVNLDVRTGGKTVDVITTNGCVELVGDKNVSSHLMLG